MVTLQEETVHNYDVVSVQYSELHHKYTLLTT